ncbi:organic hydroperoxide reductase OsmC/OhrA [Pseudomonas frederiksbergensis]
MRIEKVLTMPPSPVGRPVDLPDHAARAGGAGHPGTNPEQLFASDYNACFLGP